MPPDTLGLCDDPKRPKGVPKIHIKKTQSLPEFLSTGVHEALHAMQWDLSEEAVLEIERDLVRFILRLLEFYLSEQEK